MAESKKVGQVNFEVRADTSKLDADLEAARRKTIEATNRIPPVMPGGGMPGMPGGPGVPTQPPPIPTGIPGGPGVPGQPDFLDPMKGLGRWRSAMGLILQVSAAGVAAGVAISKAWDTFFVGGAEKAKKFKEALDLSDLKGSTDALSKEYQDLTNRLDKALQGGFLNTINMLLKGDTTGRLKERIKEIQDTLANQQEAQAAQEMRKREKRTRDEITEIEKRVEAERIAGLKGEEKLQAELDRDIKAIEDRRAQTSNEMLLAALDKEIASRKDRYKRDVADYKASEEEKAQQKRDIEERDQRQIEARVTARRISLLDGEAKIIAQARADQADIDEQFTEATTEEAKAALLEEFNLRAAQYEKDLAAFRANENEKKKAADERLAAEAAAQEREIQKTSEMWQQFVRSQAQAQQQIRDANNQVMSAGNIDATSGNIGLILTTLSAQMAGITDSLVQSVKTSPYE